MNEFQDTSTTGGPRQIDWSLLRPYARGLQIVGWALVALFFGNVLSILFVFGRDSTAAEILRAGFMELRQTLFPGLIVLVLAQLMRCLADRECSPGRFLRHGHWILLLYGVLLLESLAVWAYSFSPYGSRPPEQRGVLMALMACSPILVRAIIVIGAALVIRRLVSIIEESKTLV